MRRSAKHIALNLILASAMPLAACTGGSNNELPYPTAPTVNTLPPSTPSPTPPPVVTQPPVDPNATVTITGRVLYLRRSGVNDLDVTFRIDNFTIVSATSTTPIHSGTLIGQTDFLREGQLVTADGRRDGEFLYASKITILAF
jgi:hypothetical protein